jgi:hypothetical protein
MMSSLIPPGFAGGTGTVVDDAIVTFRLPAALAAARALAICWASAILLGLPNPSPIVDPPVPGTVTDDGGEFFATSFSPVSSY